MASPRLGSDLAGCSVSASLGPAKPVACVARAAGDAEADADIAAVAAAADAEAEASAQPLAGRVAIVTGARGASGAHRGEPRAGLRVALAASLPRDMSPARPARGRSSTRPPGSALSAAGAHILVANAGVLDDKYPSLAATATEAFDRVLGVDVRLRVSLSYSRVASHLLQLYRGLRKKSQSMLRVPVCG
uniref:Uncharacterized protein n=1 Tax=Setaria viridis TaxID=4556 RepID=A0A4V6DAM3_SETVI|nr:hypothetical protein SEVIR_2G050200v2 [Setaria viridis]